MVVGKTSSFIEGFETITTDNKILKENVSKFLAYAMKNQKIPDLDPNMSYNTNPTMSEPTMPTGMALNKMMNQNMPNMKPSQSIMEPTMSSNMSSNMKPSMMEPTMPTGMPMPTMKQSMMEPTMPSNMSSNMKPSMMKPTMPTPSMTGVMLPSKKNNTIIKPGMKSSFKNVRNSEDEGEEDEMDSEETENTEEDEMNNQENQEDDEHEEDMIEKRDKSKTRRQQKDDFEEGFQGSSMLEAKNLKNILLALLLSFIGYLVVYAYKHDYIPIKDISPQLVKFKHLVYGGLFFIIAYICLEIF